MPLPSKSTIRTFSELHRHRWCLIRNREMLTKQPQKLWPPLFFQNSALRPNRLFTTSTITMSRLDAEKLIQRNPHPDFKKVEANREPWDKSLSWNIKQTVKPDWKYGDGANDGGASLKIPHVEIDPYAEGRPAVYNYKLLI